MQLSKIKATRNNSSKLQIALDTEIMTAKEIRDLENDNALKWDLEVPEYSVCTGTS